MNIDKNSVVTIDYAVLDEDGGLLESSENEPLTYIHGMGVLAPGLEKAMMGAGEGTDLDMTLQPEDAFGRRDEQLVLEVGLDDFENPDDVETGMNFQAEIGEEIRFCTVKSIEDGRVVVDANHPFADRVLRFRVTVKAIREATEEELDHGHVHDAHGHHHAH